MIPLEKNPFQVLYVDITHRCNERCRYCYDFENRDKSDLDLKTWEEICRRLPKRVMFRILGGEPTLHPDFFGFLDIAEKYGHVTTVSSNGIRFRDPDFVRRMKKYTTIFNLSMDGGLIRDDVYEFITGRQNVTAEKRQALDVLNDVGLYNLSISAIIIRGVNEDIIPHFFGLKEKYPVINWIKFRSIGKIGRHIEYIDGFPESGVPYTTDDFLDVLRKHASEDNLVRDRVQFSKKDYQICRNCCYHFIKRPENIFVSFVEFGSLNSTRCWRRGKLLEKDLAVKPFFKYMVDTYKPKQEVVKHGKGTNRKNCTGCGERDCCSHEREGEAVPYV